MPKLPTFQAVAKQLLSGPTSEERFAADATRKRRPRDVTVDTVQSRAAARFESDAAFARRVRLVHAKTTPSGVAVTLRYVATVLQANDELETPNA